MQYKLLVKKISVSADKKIKQKEYLPIGKLPIIDQGKQLIGGYSDDLSKHISCNLPVIIFGDHTKNVKLIPFQFAAGADGIKVLEPKNNISPKYLYYGTLYLTFRIEDKGYARHYQHIEKQDLPVPSLPEQERIVARIEELFSELDKSVETLKKTKAQLTVYRQAVLKEAFEKAGNKRVSLGSLIEKPKYGTSKKCNYSHSLNNTAVFRIPNIDYKTGIINQEDLKYAEFTDVELSTNNLKENDVLIIRSNGSVSLVGRSAVVRRADTNAVFAGYLMRLRLLNVSETKAKFLHYFLESHEARIYIETVAKSTSGVNNINSQEINKLKIPICDDEILKLIVSEIESRLSVCDSIEKTVDTALQEAEAMRQIILKQAFEGKLI